jgi:hypothetical protein
MLFGTYSVADEESFVSASMVFLFRLQVGSDDPKTR